jgi:hypothetical protein
VTAGLWWGSMGAVAAVGSSLGDKALGEGRGQGRE